MAQAKIVIKAQDQTKQGINSAKSNLKELNEFASELGINLSKLTSTAIVATGLTALAKCAKECASAFLETENTYLTLKATLGNTSDYNKAINSIDKLSKSTLSSKEDVAKLYTELAQLGKSEEDINKIIEASINLSNVTGKSLTESFNVMLDSLDGSTGTLQKYLPEVKNLTKEELALGEAIDLVNEAWSETSKGISLESYSQQIKNIKDDVNSIAESLGNILLNNTSSVISTISGWISDLKDNFSVLQKQSNIYKSADSSTAVGAVLKGLTGTVSNKLTDGTTNYKSAITSQQDTIDVANKIVELYEEGIVINQSQAEYLEDILNYCMQINPSLKSYMKEIISSTKSSEKEELSIPEGKEIDWKNTGYKGITQRYRISQYDSDYTFNTVGTKYDEEKWTEYSTKKQKADENAYSNYSTGIQEILKLLDTKGIAKSEMNYIEKYGEEFIRLVYSSTSSVRDGVQQRYDELTTVYTEANKQIQDLLEEWGSTALSTISSFSSYLSDDDQEILNGILQEQNLQTLKESVQALELLGDTDSEKVKLLNTIISNIESGIDVNLPSSVRSILSSNKKYLSDETKNEYEIAVLEESIAEMQETFNKAVEQMNLGNGDYTDLELKMMDEIISGQQKELNELRNPTDSTTKLDWSSFGDVFKDSYDSAINTESIDTSLLDSLSSSLGSLFEAIEPLVNVIMSSNPIIAFLILIVKEMAEILSPFLSDTIKPFTELIHTFAESLSGWITPILNVIKGVLSGICDILEMVFLPILEIITPIIQGICGVLQVLKPIMEFFKECFIEISTVITFVADCVKYAIWSFLNWLDGIEIDLGWFGTYRPFEGVGGYDISSLDSYDSGTGGVNIANTKKSLQEKYAYDPTDWTATGEDTSTSTSVSTASYTGANNYYFNIYQQAPVVGDGGMQEFAKMIKMEFAELAYIGA